MMCVPLLGLDGEPTGILNVDSQNPLGQFSNDDLDVAVKEDTLSISAKVAKNDAENAYLHRGIAGRSFERRFALAEHIKVAGANLVNGLLHIDLNREVPEEKKPRKIEIATAGDRKKVSA